MVIFVQQLILVDFQIIMSLFLPVFMELDRNCQQPKYKNLKMSRNIGIVRMSFSPMSRNTLQKSPKSPSEFSQHLLVSTAFTYIVPVFVIVPIIFNDKLLSDSKVLHVFSTSHLSAIITFWQHLSFRWMTLKKMPPRKDASSSHEGQACHFVLSFLVLVHLRGSCRGILVMHD